MPRTFNRPPRQQLPTLPNLEIDIPPPPQPVAPPSGNWLIGILPVMGIGVMALFYVWRAAAVQTSSALFAVPLFILAVFAIGGTIAATRYRQRDHIRREETRTLTYIRTLEKKRARLHAAHVAQVGILSASYPPAETALERALSHDNQLWERRPEDTDFLTLRVGVGRVPSPIDLMTPDPDAASPLLERALRLADRYRHIDNAPVIVPLHEPLGICGRRDLLVGAVRAMLCGLALSHAPSDLNIYVISANREDWMWMNWLPHTSDSLAFDPLAVRVLLGELSQLMDTRQKVPNVLSPHILVIFDNPALAESESVYNVILNNGAVLGASAICLAPTYANIPGACSRVVNILNNGAFRLHQIGQDTPQIGETVDRLSLNEVEPIARGLASVNLRETGVSGRIPRRINFLELYGMNRAAELKAAIRHNWKRPIPEGVLPFPIMVGRESLTSNMVLMLDEDHHGPHGVVAGTTGSGKSELFQTLVCGLALQHDPRLVNFLLIDFKGGSTFNAFAKLPHTVGTVTNLDGVLVARALAALRAEIKYRQQFLKSNNVRDITQYYRFYGTAPEQINAPDFQPLPHLFVIVDEFAQLAKSMPDFMGELVRTAQVGRSLGLHLILGTQSPMEVVTEEMNANLQFRICLRVQNAEASRAMLRRPDAAYLPAGLAGRGYFMVGERGIYKQFQGAYVGGDYRDDAIGDEPMVLDLLMEGGDSVSLLQDYESSHIVLSDGEPYTTASAIIDVICDYTEAHNLPYMPPLLLPPLDDRLTLEDAFVHMDFGGWNGAAWQPRGTNEDEMPIAVGSAPIGIVDDVNSRYQSPFWVHLNNTDNGGHMMVFGGPGSGKTTLLNTLAVSLAWLHHPDELHIYPLSFSGNGLNVIGNLPHAERTILGTESERVRRLFGRLMTLLDERQTSRKRSRSSTIVLLLDGYEGFRDSYYEQHMGALERLITEGRNASIFVVFTAATVTAIPDRLRSLIPARVALHLNNAGDYLLSVGEVNMTTSLPAGRGFIPGSPALVVQVSLPILGNAINHDDIDRDLRQLVNDMRQGLARQGRMQAPAAITELPAFIQLENLPEPTKTAPVVTVLGQLDDDALTPFELDWDEAGPHFVVTGPPAGGKTNLLNAAVISAALAYSPEQIRFLLVDISGRSLGKLEPLKHVLARATDSLELRTQLGYLASEIKAHSHSNSIRTVLVIDDYEIAADLMSTDLDLLRQLRDHARLHTDSGLHIWVAGYLERVGDPLLKQLLLRRSGFALREREALHNLNVRASVPAEAMPPGRAYFAQHNRVMVVQTALVDDVAVYVDHINQRRWRDAAPAMWRAPLRLPTPPQPHNSPQLPPNDPPQNLDIDTTGLIDDLLGG